MNKLRLLRNILLIIISGVVLFILSDWMLTASDRYRVYPVDMNDTLGTRGVYIGGIDNTKPSVIVMGCSFAFGVDLKDFETLPDKIQKFTGRKTLNFAFPAHSIQHVLYKIQKFDEFEYEVKNADYVIYVFISDHLRRMYLNYFDKYAQAKYLKYRKRKNTFEHDNFSVTLLDYFKTTTIARRSNDFFYTLKSDNEKFELFKQYIKECKKSLYEKNPNCKFVLIVYNSTESSKRMGITPFHTNRWKEIEDEGIIVINFDTSKYDFLNDDEYIASDELHPSEKAWDRLVPVIARQLNL